MAGIARMSIAAALLGGALTTHASRAGTPDDFSDEAMARGINYVDATSYPNFGSGVAFVDLDNDGDPDVVLLGHLAGIIGLYENDGTGMFADRGPGSGMPNVPGATGVSAADYDDDGDLDLHISCYLQPNALLRNDGNFQFVDVTAAAGLGDAGAGGGCAWADIDGDGWLDFYVANRTGTFEDPTPNRMFRNEGDATFEEVAMALGIDRADDPTLLVAFLDFDRDGDADLYVGNDKGSGPFRQNYLYQNDGVGGFTDVTAASGTAANVDCMGIAVGDWTRNGWQDLYVTNVPHGNVLLHNQGDGTFVDATLVADVGIYEIGWGTMFVDVDNDGWEELYVCNMLAADCLYDADGVFPAVNVAPSTGLADSATSFCCASADVDDDGDVDLLVQSANEPIRLYINSDDGTREWVKFDVRGTAGNRFAVGAQVDVGTGVMPDTVWQMREVRAGTNYKSQNEMILHFGLDGAPLIDDAITTWPGGASRHFKKIPSRSTWTLYHPDSLADADGDGDVELDDYLAFTTCFTGPVTGALIPGCEMMDLDGDWDVDSDDFDGLVTRYAASDDCNGNGTLDIVDLFNGTSVDLDGDGVPDECGCPADFNDDGQVGFSDLVAVLSTWGPCPDCPTDLDASGSVGFGDLIQVLSTWGDCP